MNKYLAKQFSGQLAQDTINSIQTESQVVDPILSYWHDLSIDTADANDLDAIGKLVGITWPTAPAGSLDSNAFALGAAASYPQSSAIGLSGIGLLSGGILSSALPSANDKIPIDSYRVILKAVAYVKYNGLNWTSIDKIASSFGTLNYTYLNPSYYRFTLGSAASYPESNTVNGLGGVSVTYGGRLGSVNPSYFPDSDITIAYITPLTNANLWIIKEIFTLLETSPRVFVQNGV